MSYARWGWDGSDVYVFDSSRQPGGLECCACRLNEPDKEWEEGDPLFADSFMTRDVDEMFAHLAAHRAAGHTVPSYVENEILADFPAGWYDRLKDR